MALSKPDVKIVDHKYESYTVIKDPVTCVISPSLPPFKLQPPKVESKRKCCYVKYYEIFSIFTFLQACVSASRF